MKIAIISDSHDNVANFKNVIGWLNKEKIKTIIHCGDVFSSETIKEVSRDFNGKIYLVLSDAENGDFNGLSKVKSWENVGEIKIGGKKIAFCHFPELAESLASRQEYDLVFYGHTHKPWIKRFKKTRLINPGNLVGIFYKPTFAVYDTKTDKLELKILEKLNEPKKD